VRTIFSRSILASMIVGLFFVAACAKRPVATVSQAPAPAPAPRPAPAPAPPPAAAPAPSPPAAAAPPPAAPRPAPKDYRPTDALKSINFAFDSATIRSADAKILDASAAWLVKNGDYLLLIEGHCDERGTDEYNLALGDRRARSALNYLVAQGVKGDRITIVSFGEQRPLCRESNEACWAKNRRDMFLIKER
jgi:peptidoglycan-associated lipoprotein